MSVGENLPYYPVFLNLRGRRCLVVGGGRVARRKVEGLLEAGAEVTVVAPACVPMPPGAHIEQRAFQPEDVTGVMLVFAATDDPAVNAAVAQDADARGIPVNVADDAERCSMLIPAVVRRGALRIAVSTGSASPALAQELRKELEAHYGQEYGELVELLGELRREWEPELITAGLDAPARGELWHEILRLPLLDALRASDRLKAAALATTLIVERISKVK